jgi:hypothetical protein
MFLAVLSAIAISAGATMAINDLQDEQLSATPEPVVEVAPIQQDAGQAGDLGW